MARRAISRRRFVALCGVTAGAVAAGCTPVVTEAAADYPRRNVEIIVPFAAGGLTDLVGRVLAEGLSRALSQDGHRIQVSVVNRPGASGVVGAAELMNSNPDGYTLGMVTGTAYGVQAHFDSSPYGPDDLTPVAQLATLPNVLVVNARSDFESLEDIARASRQGPRSLAYATTGVGSIAHINFLLLAHEANIGTTHIPYEGNAPVMNALLGNHIDAAVVQSLDAKQYVDSGDVRPLVVMGSHLPDGFEDVPLSTDLGYAKGHDLFYGLAAPPDLDPALLTTIEAAVDEALGLPQTVERLASLDIEADFLDSRGLRLEVEALRPVVQRAVEANGDPIK